MKNSAHEKHEKCEKKIFKNPRITRQLPPHASVLQNQNTAQVQLQTQDVANSLLRDKDLIQFIRNNNNQNDKTNNNTNTDDKADITNWLLSTLSAKNIKKHLNQPLYTFVGLSYLIRQCNFNDEELAILDELEIFNKDNFEKFYSDDSYANYQRLLTEILQIYKQTDKEIFQAVKSIFEYVYEQKLSNELSLYQQFNRYVYQALQKSKDFLQKISQSNIAVMKAQCQIQNQNQNQIQIQNQKLWHSLAAIRENLIKYSLYVKDPSNEDYQILLPLKSFFKKVDLVDKNANTTNDNSTHTNISITNIHTNIPQSDLASIVQQNEICVKLYIVSQHFYELSAFQKLDHHMKEFYKNFYKLMFQNVYEKLKDHPYYPFIVKTQLPLTLPYYSYLNNGAIKVLISQHGVSLVNNVILKIFSKEFDLPDNSIQESYDNVVNLMKDYEGIAQEQLEQEQMGQERMQQNQNLQNQITLDSIIRQQWQCIKETMLKHYEQMQILHKLNMFITFYLNVFNSFKEACRSKISTQEIENRLNELTLKKRCPEQIQMQTQNQMQTQTQTQNQM